MENLKLRFTGQSALLMHSDRYANPLDAMAKRHKQLTSKRKKTDEDHVEIARSEWEGSLYFDDSAGPYMPSINVRSCIVEGGKLNKLGAAIQRGTIIMDDVLPLAYDGPRTLDALWADAKFRDVRSVVVARQRLMRCRPRFSAWGVEFDIYYDPSIIDRAQLFQAAVNAGQFIGLGDYRPNKGGPFGRFEVTAKN